MHFFRHRPRLGCLALLALAMQLAGSFAHFHATRAGQESAALACRTFFPPAPAQPCPPSHRDDKCCAICWTMALAGSVAVPEGPVLALPELAAGSVLPDCARRLAARVPTAAFQARGPPSSFEI